MRFNPKSQDNPVPALTPAGQFDAIYIEPGAQTYPMTQTVLERLPDVPVKPWVEPDRLRQSLRREAGDVFGAGKKHLVLSRFKGDFLKKCPGISPGMVCCNYYVVNLIKNCIYDCSYCFLQDFLDNNPVLTAFVNIEDLLQELDTAFRQNPDRSFRVGTGELTDSLALEDFLPYNNWLLPFFADRPQAVLELKTKSDCVDSLVAQPGLENVVVSWSLNPASLAVSEEKGTPPVQARLRAAQRCAAAGYRVGFHFDPVILFPGWEAAYEELVDQLFDCVPVPAIEWISLGSFRYRRQLKPIIRERHPGTVLFHSEHLPSEDGKFRYLRPLREKAYEFLRQLIQKRAESTPVYMCMETKEIWEGVTGKTPRADEKLDVFFDL